MAYPWGWKMGLGGNRIGGGLVKSGSRKDDCKGTGNRNTGGGGIEKPGLKWGDSGDDCSGDSLGLVEETLGS